MSETVTKVTTFTKYYPDEVTPEILDSFCTLVFDNGTIENDEMAGITDGKVWLSSYKNGLIDWDGNEYVHSYHWSKEPFGQLKYVLVENE